MCQIIPIDDPTDDRISRFANLKNPKRLSLPGTFIVEGRWCVQRFIDSRFEVDSVLVQRGRETEYADSLDPSVPLYVLSREHIRNLVGYDFHRGVLAAGTRLPWSNPTQLRMASPGARIALAILGVTEHENLGSIIRTATAFGIDHVLIGPDTIDPFSRRVIRVSMGTIFQQNLYDLDRPLEQLEALTQEGVRTIVTTLRAGAATLDDLELDDRDCLLIVGNEAQGVSEAIHRLASDQVKIPMKLGTDSLNVAVASAIFIHDLCRKQQGRD